MAKEFIIRYLKHIARLWAEEYLRWRAYEENENVTIEKQAEMKLEYKNKKKLQIKRIKLS